jgi:serine/threonine protein kinase
LFFETIGSLRRIDKCQHTEKTMSVDPNAAKAIFMTALDMSDAAERAAFLAEACGGDELLRQRVEVLLKAHSDPGSFLAGPAAASGATLDVPLAESLGSKIGPYKLVDQIGEGGFGVVFMAEQQQPIRRKVALKVIKPGMDTRQVIARFEAERQALALMEHPNIAHVLDGGETATGRPYFVMELVRGAAITEHCDRYYLPVRHRLDLFANVCQAVQHAHQKGIIHRDIKPSNVLVTLHDGTPVVKVIDFGVAKAIGQQLTEKSLFTNFAQMIGTPLYMSPEQAEFSGLDVDTRTDIYALGVLLYELLTGTTPFDRERLHTAGFDEIRRVIREEEPAKPSTRISTMGAALSTVSENRQTDPRRLSGLLRGELDWIVMKCLEKDRARRYDTANGLARDIVRYLNGEPVDAGPPSIGYKARKFAYKHRKVLGVAVAFVLLLVGTSAVSIWQALRASDQRDKAVAQKERADEEADTSAAVSDFLINDLLNQAGSKAQAQRKFQPDPNLTIRQALDRAAAAVSDKFRDRPKLEATIRRTLGDAYLQVGHYEKAIVQLRQSADIFKAYLGLKHAKTLAGLHSLALAYQHAGKATEAISLIEQVRDVQIKDLGPEHPDTLRTLNNLVAAYQAAGKTTEFIATFEQIRNAQVQTLGPDHRDTLITRHNVAWAYLDAGRTTEAIAQFEELLDVKVKKLGPDHPETLPTLLNLGTAHWKVKQFDKSIPLFESLLTASGKVHGEQHPDTLDVLANLGVNYRDAGRLAEAIPLLEQAYRQSRNPAVLRWVAVELLIAYVRAGESTKAFALSKECLQAARKELAADSPPLAKVLSQNGHALLQLKAWSDAEQILRECLAIRQRDEADAWTTFNTQSMLGAAHLGQQKYAEAEPLLLQGYEGLKVRETKIPKVTTAYLADALERLVQLYDALGKDAEAARWREELANEKAR